MEDFTKTVGKKQEATKREGYRRREVDAKELYDEIKRQVQIVDYARECGLTLVRKGRYYSLADHDSVRINPEKNCYWRNSVAGRNGAAKGDSVIGFAAEFVHQGDMLETLKELSAKIYVSGQDYKREPLVTKARNMPEERNLVLPKRGENMRKAYAYLIKSRYVDQEVVQDFVNRKMLYQDVKGNCVFVSYGKDQKPNFSCFRGTLSKVKFLGDAPGCDYKAGFYVHNGAKKLIITESVIDAMSIMSILKEQGIVYKEYDYLCMGGTGKYEAVLEHLRVDPKEEVLLALDHDLSGVESMQHMASLLMKELKMDREQVTYHVPDRKDWNQELAEAASRFKPLSKIGFLRDTGLPKIHYCAIQSTEQLEEKGFRNREGRHQYRLVELDEAGSLVPVTISERNIMFFSPKEVKERIPNMYKLISYGELQMMQEKEMEVAVGKEDIREVARDAKEVGQTGNTQREVPVIKEFFLDQGYCMATLVYRGNETVEGIWKNKDGFYVTTGWAAEDSLEEHPFTEKQCEELQAFLRACGGLVIEESPLLQLEGTKKNTYTKGRNGMSLDNLQKTELERNQEAITEPAPNMEMVL